jgi:hypothetical protein
VRALLRAAQRFWPFGEPIIPMYTYDPQAVQQLLESERCEVRLHNVETDRFEKAIVVFRKR